MIKTLPACSSIRQEDRVDTSPLALGAFGSAGLPAAAEVAAGVFARHPVGAFDRRGAAATAGQINRNLSIGHFHWPEDQMHLGSVAEPLAGLPLPRSRQRSDAV